MHTTSPTLLERLQQGGDEAAWRRLVQLYTPLLFAWGRRCGQSEQDTADLVQEVFVALLQTLPTFLYEQHRGQFRNWLRTLLVNKLRDRIRRAAREKKGLAQLDNEVEVIDVATRFWETEYQRELTGRALRLMQSDFTPTTWQAFWLTVVEGRCREEAAQQLGISRNAVSVARCRVLRRLRQDLGGLID
jgi:RNA polymerase sigma-70 factor (ECF subfamily)